MKIWSKLVVEEKLADNFIYYSDLKLNRDNFFTMVREISEQLNISTPVILSMHYNHFRQFGIIKFLPSDFIDHEPFDYLELESVKK